MATDKRNIIIQTNRMAKTAIDIFDEVLKKDHLEKKDLQLIIEKIWVYENRLEIQLKSDVDQILNCGLVGKAVNFNLGMENITNYTIVQQTNKHMDKVFHANVISSGDPLEIYTDRDGEVIFKKYSPMGELGTFADELVDALSRTSGLSCVICDRDSVIAAAGGAKKEVYEKTVSDAIDNVMKNRKVYQYKGEAENIHVSEQDNYTVIAATPIISDGDVTGCVAFLSDKDIAATDVETKLTQTAASFLSKHVTM